MPVSEHIKKIPLQPVKHMSRHEVVRSRGIFLRTFSSVRADSVLHPGHEAGCAPWRSDVQQRLGGV